MKILFLTETDVVNYKKTSMTIGLPHCDGKCWRDLNKKNPPNSHWKGYDWSLCHNGSLISLPSIDIDDDDIINRYLKNPMSSAIVFAGLEPLDSASELLDFIHRFRIIHKCDDDVVIYTGYTEEEVSTMNFIQKLSDSGIQNIVIKFGRYIPDNKSHFDQILGVKLASDNQYAKRVL